MTKVRVVGQILVLIVCCAWRRRQCSTKGLVTSTHVPQLLMQRVTTTNRRYGALTSTHSLKQIIALQQSALQPITYRIQCRQCHCIL